MDKLILLKSYLSPQLSNAVKAAAALKGISIQAFVAEVLAHEPNIIKLMAQARRGA
jgi:predicted DNA binding CopG/RHH family protein